MSKLVEGKDYFLNKDGLMVFTKEYHLKRGYCCESGCSECPYGYHERVDPSVPSEFQDPWKPTLEESAEKYLKDFDE